MALLVNHVQQAKSHTNNVHTLFQELHAQSRLVLSTLDGYRVADPIPAILATQSPISPFPVVNDLEITEEEVGISQKMPSKSRKKKTRTELLTIRRQIVSASLLPKGLSRWFRPTTTVEIELLLGGRCGFSISPSITTFNLVDEKTCPAFSLFAPFEHNHVSCWQFGSYPEDYPERFASQYRDKPYLPEASLQKLSVLPQQLAKLYEDGKASPYARNSFGRSLPHVSLLIASASM